MSEATSNKKPYFGLTGMALNAWVNVACITAMTLFGYDQGVYGGIIVTEDFLRTMGHPNSQLQGTIVSLYDIGCFVGAMSSFAFGEKLGRKKMLIIGVVVMSIGAIIQTASFNVTTILVSRIITGLGNGCISLLLRYFSSSDGFSQYQHGQRSGLAKRDHKGVPSRNGDNSRDDVRFSTYWCLLLHQSFSSMNIAGYALSNWITFGLSYVEGSISWRLPLAFQLVFSIILLGTIPWLPESPRWLLAHGHEEQGAAILAALEGDHVKPTDIVIIERKTEILEAVRIEKETSPSWSDLLRGRTGQSGMVKRMILGIGTQLMQQLSGINVTTYYLPLVLQNSVGLSNSLSRLLAACNAMSYLGFSFAGLYLIERAGRRKLLMFGAAGQAVCYILIAAFLSQNSGAAATAFFFLFYVFFGSCWQGVPWLYPVEINSLSMRTKGAALATGMNWIINYAVVQATPPGIDRLGWKFYLIWMSFNIAIVPIIYLFYPETSNRHLEDIDRLYREHQGMVFVFRNKEATQTERPAHYSQTDVERVAHAKTSLDVAAIDHLEHAELEAESAEKK
ncbi:related to sugar transporter [Armillaria ostoyae]|uniref:Related to sugar transporter n=1 Tax=Armillaria ostoyae TaxID=47428 RepID=A0A284S0N0_ARMOS|nr:related to sugar transporter [Armillaria ostoyae]